MYYFLCIFIQRQRRMMTALISLKFKITLSYFVNRSPKFDFFSNFGELKGRSPHPSQDKNAGTRTLTIFINKSKITSFISFLTLITAYMYIYIYIYK